MEERMEIQETDWIEVCLRSPPVASRNPGKTSGKAPHREDPLHHDNKDHVGAWMLLILLTRNQLLQLFTKLHLVPLHRLRLSSLS